MKKLILLSACLLALAARPAAAQTPGPDIVVVRIFEGNNGSTQLVVTRGEGKSEKIEFPSEGTDKRRIAASEGYYKVLSGLYREGYVLKSTFSTALAYTTLVLEKSR